ncbi:HNH endonuclease [bacterium]|nr:HNH endonuclease [bacterium]
MAARDVNGYGRVRWGSKTYFAHRIAYEEQVGPIADGLAVCHRCDNPPCVNPEHLFAADQSINVADMIAKGRQRHAAKLNADQVRSIRNDQRLIRIIAAEYGVDESTVSKIRLRKRWQWVV